MLEAYFQLSMPRRSTKVSETDETEPLFWPTSHTTERSDRRKRKRKARNRSTNRIAASKHRSKKREYIRRLESRHGEQMQRNDLLKSEIVTLREERSDLQEALFVHSECLDEPIQNYISCKIKHAYASWPAARAEEGFSDVP